MNKIFYLCIGFIIGIFITFFIFLKELCGKININAIKKLWKIINNDQN
jgi:hypothetical protein